MRKFNILKIVLIILLLIAPVFYYSCNSCGNEPNVEYNEDSLTVDTAGIVFGARMYNAFEQEFSKRQFDSICKADKISNDLKKWHQFSSRDGETREVIIEYLYIKYENNGEYMYRLIKIDPNKFKITKRIKK